MNDKDFCLSDQVYKAGQKKVFKSIAKMKVASIIFACVCLRLSESVKQNVADLRKDTNNLKLPNNRLTSNTWSFIEQPETKTGNPYTRGLSPCPLDVDADGIYYITVPGHETFPVVCNAQIAGPGYIEIARRTNADLSFFRNWEEYKNGFGYLYNDFFIGLDKLHAITKSQAYELYIHLEDWQGQTRFARYAGFYIDNENESYKLSTLGDYTGDAGDSLRRNQNQKFTTYDRDNDSWNSGNCAINRIGGWWYNQCTATNLFGTYAGDLTGRSIDFEAMTWDYWKEEYSFKNLTMMIRPKCNC